MAEASPTITVCGLGPGGPGRVTAETRDLLECSTVGFLRTRRHPSAALATGFSAFDELYDRLDSFESVYSAITETLVEAALAHGSITYAVPGSPLVLEQSVRALRAVPDVEVRLLPAISFLDEVWARLGVDPVDDGVRLIDGHRFATEAAGERGPLLVAHTHAQWVLSDMKLALDAGPEQRAVLVKALGTEAEQVVEVGWPELDRTIEADHLTSVFIPSLQAPVGRDLLASVELMEQLRASCPWDQAQDHASLRPYLVEEAAEVLDALDELVAVQNRRPPGDGIGWGTDPETDPDIDFESDLDAAYENLESELGDLWFQILFHARLASEAGRFEISDVARSLVDKMVHRHPHVFLDSDYEAANWDRLKAAPANASVIDSVPLSLPALARAAKVLARATKNGPPADLGHLGPQVETMIETVGLGPLLLAVTAVAQRQGLDPEGALRGALKQAETRFRARAGDQAPDGRWVLG